MNQTWHKATLGEGDSSLSNERPHSLPRGDNNKIWKYIDKINLKIIFSRTTGPISIKLIMPNCVYWLELFLRWAMWPMNILWKNLKNGQQKIITLKNCYPEQWFLMGFILSQILQWLLSVMRGTHVHLIQSGNWEYLKKNKIYPRHLSAISTHAKKSKVIISKNESNDT